MSRMILILAGTFLTLSLAAGTALALEMASNYTVARGDAALEDARTAADSQSKVGPMLMANQSRAKKELGSLLGEAKSGKIVNPGEIESLIVEVGK